MVRLIAAAVGSESGAKLRLGVTGERGYGRYGGARVLDRLSKFFPDQFIGVLRSSAAGARVRHVQPSDGVVSGRGA